MTLTKARLVDKDNFLFIFELDNSNKTQIKVGISKENIKFKDILKKLVARAQRSDIWFNIEVNEYEGKFWLNTLEQIEEVKKEKTLSESIPDNSNYKLGDTYAKQKEKEAEVEKKVDEAKEVIFKEEKEFFTGADKLESLSPKILALRKMKLIQCELKIDKGNKVNTGAKTYNYWSTDDILKEVKPLLDKYNCIIELSDKILHFQDEGKIITKTKTKLGDPLNTSTTQSRFYIETTATLYDCEGGGCVQSTANAREQREKYGMDEPQLTGSSSSYARKFALSGLLLLDDNKDIDSMENKK